MLALIMIESVAVTMYGTILHPTDGDDGSTAAAEEALDVAERCGSTVHVVHVVDLDGLGGYFSAGGLPEEFVDRALEEGEQRAERVADRFREAGVPVRTDVLKGSPGQAIVDYVDERGIDLVVMGTRGRSGVRRVLLGSVAENVVRLADCPVLTVKTDESGDGDGIDGNDGGEKAGGVDADVRGGRS